MPEVITEVEEIAGKILSIIKAATKELVIVSPYVQISDWDRVKQALAFILKEKKDVKIVFVTRSIYDKDPTEREEENASNNRSIDELKDFEGKAKIYLASNLHSKIYYNGKQALVTSMNLFQHSAENNHEIAVYFDEDAKNIEKIKGHIDYIVSTSPLFQSPAQIKDEEKYLSTQKKEDLVPERFAVLSVGRKWVKVVTSAGYENKILIVNAPGLKIGAEYEAKVRKKWTKTPVGFDVELLDIAGLKKVQGFCIKCGTPVDLDPTRPLCYACYAQSAQYRGNIFGRVCHACGNEAPNILDSKPLCITCYKARN